MATLANLSPRTQQVAQLATKITHVTEAFQAGSEQLDLAKSMDAVLDPNDPVQGSAVGSEDDESKLSVALKDKFPTSLHRAHLLHHDLGGFGVNANLYPMTALANRAHEREVESLVLGALHKENNIRGVHYTVTVNPTGERSVEGLKSKTSFDCKAHYHDINSGKDLNQIVETSIESKPLLLKDNPKPPTRDNGQEKTQSELSSTELAEWGYGEFKSYTIPNKWRHYGRSILKDSQFQNSRKWCGNVSDTERKGSGRDALDFNSQRRELGEEIDNSGGGNNTLDDYIKSEKIAIKKLGSKIGQNHEGNFDQSALSTRSSGLGGGAPTNHLSTVKNKKRTGATASSSNSSSKSVKGRGIHSQFKPPGRVKVKEVDQEKIKEQKIQEKEQKSDDSSEENLEPSKKKSKQVHQAGSSEEENIQDELELLIVSIISGKGHGWSGPIVLSDENAELTLDMAGIPKRYKNILIEKVYELSNTK